MVEWVTVLFSRGHKRLAREESSLSKWVERFVSAEQGSATNLALWGRTKMFIRDSLAEFGETAVHAGNAADREWSPNATTSNPSHESKLLHVWFDGNREAVENNTFFSPAVESGGLVKVIPGRKERKWTHGRVEAGVFGRMVE